jgi:hypothetical protein
MLRWKNRFVRYSAVVASLVLLTLYASAAQAQAPVVGDVTITVNYGQALQLSIQNTTATSVNVTSTPALGTATVSGLNITYSPKTGYYGSDSFTYTGSNASGTSNTATIYVTISPPSLSVVSTSSTTTTLPGGTAGTAYSQSLTASGGAASYHYSTTLASGSLPTGLSLSTTGAITGTPSSVGTYTFAVTVTDSSKNTAWTQASGTLTLTIAAPTISISPASATAAVVGTAYSQTYTASGGVAPYTYSVSSGSLPPGLTLTGAVLSGTPTTPGSYNFTIKAQDSTTGTGAPFSGTRAYSAVTVSPVAVTESTTVAANSSGNVINVTSNDLGSPTSISISTAPAHGTATVSGLTVLYTPTASYFGSDSFAYKVTANGVTSAAVTDTITVNPPAPTAGAVSATVAYDASATTVMTGTTSIVPSPAAVTTTVAIASAASHGTAAVSGTNITYTPTNGYYGSDSFTYTATNVTGTSSAATATITVSAPTLAITPTSLPAASIGAAYSQNLSTSGGKAPYTYTTTLVSGSLPTGLSLSSTGAITGTPTQVGSFSFTVRVTDSSTLTPATAVSSTISLTVSNPALVISPSTLTNPVFGTAYSQTLTTTGGVGPYTYAITGGNLLAGLSLSSAGVISGTPTADGSASFTITATDTGSTGTGSPFTVSRAYTTSTSTPTLTLPATVSNGTVGIAYSQSVAASGGTSPYTYTVTSGSLPAGLTLNANSGAFAGTPTQAGSFAFTVHAIDNTPGGTGSASQAYTMTVAAPTVTLTPNSLPGGIAGTAYTSTTFSASGGTAPYSYSVSVGSPPAGLSLTSGSGVFSGTPTTAGSTSFTVRVTDSSTGTGAPFTATQSFTVVIADPTLSLTPTSFAVSPTVGVTYSQSVAASGGQAPYSYTVSSGALPAGLSLNVNTGILSGTPTAVASSTFTITATDSTPGTHATVTQSYTLNVAAASIVLTPASLPNPTAGSTYSQSVTASGGQAPYTYSAVGLPAGLSLNAATGLISGVPTVVGVQNFTIKAVDSSPSGPFNNTGSYSVTVGAPTLILTPTTLPNPTVGASYSQTVSVVGGSTQYHYAIASGALPAGLVLNAASGTIAGTPTAAGSATFTIKGTDSTTGTGSPFSVSQSFTLTTAVPSLSLAPTTLPNPSVGVAYSQTLVAGGGAVPYTYTVSAGQLPAGLSLNSGTGVISGTPTTSGSSSFTIHVTDSSTGPGAPFSTSLAYTLSTIQPVPITVADSALVKENAPSLIAVTANDQNGPFTSIAVVAKPSHGIATVTGLSITYQPAVGYTGNDSFTYSDTNAGGTSAPATVSITVTPLLVPQIVAQTAVVKNGLPVAINLTRGATNGPFVAAAVLTPPPSAVGETTVTGEMAVFTPKPGFTGTATFGYVLANDAGISEEAMVTVTVQPRPDPSKDPVVAGLINAQADAVQRFETAQISNFGRRMEYLHNSGDSTEGTINNGLGARLNGQSVSGMAFMPSTDPLQRIMMDPADRIRQGAGAGSGWTNPQYASTDPIHAFMAADDPDSSAPSGAGPPRPGGAPAGAGPPGSSSKLPQNVGIWVDGTVDFGSRDGTADRGHEGFATEGLSFGADYRFAPWLALGIGGGYARDSTDVSPATAGQNGGHDVAHALTVSGYGTVRVMEHGFVDALVGYGTLGFDTSRAIPDTALTATGHRDGDSMFASLTASYDMQTKDGLQLSPYGRLSGSKSTLAAFAESGTSGLELDYASENLTTMSAALGLRGEYRFNWASGILTPRFRAEFEREFQGNNAEKLAYASDPFGQSYVLDTTFPSRNQVLAGIGADYRFSDGGHISLDYQLMVDTFNEVDNSFRVALSERF